MYNSKEINKLINFVQESNIYSKPKLSKAIQEEFDLTKKGSVFYNESFAIRFSSSKKKTSFSNTVLSLKTLKKYDDKPFIICLSTPEGNSLFLGNTTFINKVSHSSKRLTLTNITGSFNGSNILKTFDNLANSPENFETLFEKHSNIGFDNNLERIVENTHNIIGRNEPLILSEEDKEKIMKSINRTVKFMESNYYNDLTKELDNLVEINKSKILEYSKIENVNVRGREIENLISNQDKKIGELMTSNDLSDYDKVYPEYKVSIDIKTKMMDKNSAPKGFNIDKLLEFLCEEKAIYLSYVIGIDDDKITTKLIPLFDKNILTTTRIVDNWSGQNARGTTQYDGNTLKLLINEELIIDIDKSLASEFLDKLINL